MSYDVRVKRIYFLLLVCCSKGETPPPKTADAPLHETAAIPTSTEASSSWSLPAESATPPPPIPSTTTSSAQTSQGKPGFASGEECDKMNMRYVQLVAENQGINLPPGFENMDIFKNANTMLKGGMREQCMKEVTRAKYDCAMAAKTMEKWRECMK